MTNKLRRAYLYANAVHTNDDEFFHVLRVALAVSPPAQVLALLHDTIECRKDNLLAVALTLGLSVDETVALRCLTREPKLHTYMEYIGIIEKAGGLAREVKIADINDNLKRPGRESLKPRYERALKVLEQA